MFRSHVLCEVVGCHMFRSFSCSGCPLEIAYMHALKRKAADLFSIVVGLKPLFFLRRDGAQQDEAPVEGGSSPGVARTYAAGHVAGLCCPVGRRHRVAQSLMSIGRAKMLRIFWNPFSQSSMRRPASKRNATRAKARKSIRTAAASATS